MKTILDEYRELGEEIQRIRNMTPQEAKQEIAALKLEIKHTRVGFGSLTKVMNLEGFIANIKAVRGL